MDKKQKEFEDALEKECLKQIKIKHFKYKIVKEISKDYHREMRS